MLKPFQIIVGADSSSPVPGETVWAAPALSGFDGWVERAGYGALKYSDYSILPTGGIELLNGLAFGAAGEVYTFHPTGILNEPEAFDYSNGFLYAKAAAALINRIGLRNETTTGYTGLVDTANQLATSGRYFNDFHSVVSAATLKDCQPNPLITPLQFNAWFTSLKRSVIMRSLNGVFSENEFLEKGAVYSCLSPSQTVLQSNEKFVGFELNTPASGDVAIKIDAISLSFDSDVSDLPIYIYEYSKKTPIYTTTVDVLGGENTQISLPNAVVTGVYGGRFFIGYYQKDLGGAKAVKFSSSKTKTYHFGVYGMEASRIIPPEPDPLLPPVAPDPDRFDRESIAYDLNHAGINLEYTVFKDFTKIITATPNLFDELIGLTMAYTAIELVLYSVRSNRNERLLKSGIVEAALIQDLTGQAPVSDAPNSSVTGLNKRIERETARVRKSIFKPIKPFAAQSCY